MGTVAGIVLTGGSGRRMGGLKPLVEYHGIALGARVAAALRAGGCRPVIAVGGSPEELAPLGLDVVADRWPGEGPLGALVTAGSAVFDDSVDSVVLAACDLGRLDGAAVARLLAADPAADVVVARGSRRHPSLMRCSPAAVAAAEAWFEAGERRLTRVVDNDELDVVDCVIDENVLLNVNWPQDLAR